MLTFVLYVTFTASGMRRAAYGAGLLILLRLWRIQRIYKTIAEEERRKLEKMLVTHRKVQKDTEEQLKQTTSKLNAVQQERDVLQQQLKVIGYIGKASPAVSSSAYSKVSEDLVTSDEESERYIDCDSQTQNPRVLIDTIQAEMAGHRFYHTSNSPSPATSFSQLVDEFLVNSEFRDFKDLSNLSKVAPTKVSVPDLVEHLQAADVLSRGAGSGEECGGYTLRATVAGVATDAALYNQRPPQQQTNSHSLSTDSTGPASPAFPPTAPAQPPLPTPCEAPGTGPVSTADTSTPEACASAQMSSAYRQLGDGDSTCGVVSADAESPRPAVPPREQGAGGTRADDKMQLLKDTATLNRSAARHRPEKGHDNMAFEGEGEGEGGSSRGAAELKKSSAVPFNKQYGSSTYLNEEGIPMTDL